MKRETLAYSADRLRMKGELFFEVGAAPRPGILVFPVAQGFNKHTLSRAERLATCMAMRRQSRTWPSPCVAP